MTTDPTRMHASISDPLGWARPVRSVARLAVDALLDACLPRTCLISNAWLGPGGPPLAPPVRAALAKIAAVPYCPHCARDARPETIYDNGCGHCRREAHWNCKQIVRIGPYISALRPLLLGIKFRGNEPAAEIVADLLAERLRRTPWLDSLDALVPVPMHRLRRWQRPCPHAQVLAEALGRRLRLPVWRAVRRTRYSASQVWATSREERFRRVKDAFSYVRGFDLRGRTVCVVDNVITSGATLCETVKTLRRAGVNVAYGCVAGRGRSQATNDPCLLHEEKAAIAG